MASLLVVGGAHVIQGNSHAGFSHGILAKELLVVLCPALGLAAKLDAVLRLFEP